MGPEGAGGRERSPGRQGVPPEEQQRAAAAAPYREPKSPGASTACVLLWTQGTFLSRVIFAPL